MYNILVTSAGGDIGGNIINILLKSRADGVKVFAADIKEHIFCENSADGFFTVPRTDAEAYGDAIVDIAAKYSIDMIIPSSEVDIMWFAANRGRFSQKILINGDKILDTFFDKLKTAATLNELSIKTPDTRPLKDYSGDLGFPTIIKTRRSIHGKGFFIVNSKPELEAVTGRINTEKYIIQKYIGNADKEYTTAVFGGGAITFRRKLTGGMTSYAEIEKIEELERYATVLTERFCITGSINIQTREADGVFYVFEINPRISSTVLIRDHFNFCDLRLWVNSAAERTICSIPTESVPEKGTAVLGFVYNFFG
ncbi:ATP-grasp domain-containing protein [Seleniivibrio sp.]|uniref:ATP-grasp domain-containing protein n=1 Tax=Seleniivibrio sp. TaxID=2898801 RepID=UPI0025CFA9A0|nr:ATP-grasp domain-containing protein [Seleniivibrio sp.]MCD8553157.1 ATP-grasp domain-containing protein [Seleniivibrio sp.]